MSTKHSFSSTLVKLRDVFASLQFELRERQKQEHPDLVDAAQRRRPNYAEHYKEQFLPPPEPVSVWFFCLYFMKF